jgi:hypothetical protein
MPLVRNSVRAFIAVVIVVIAYHGLMAALGIAQVLAEKAVPPTPDRALQYVVLRSVIDAVLLCAGQYLLRTQGVASRMGYGLMGGVALAIGYAFAVSNDMLLLRPPAGSYFTAAIIPFAVGVIAASMYAQFAGRDFSENDREVEPEPAQGTIPKDSIDVTLKPPLQEPPRTFEGPVRVRTSMSAIPIVSVIPACIYMLVLVPLFAMLARSMTQGGANWPQFATGLVLPVFFFVMVVISTAIPTAIGALVTHTIARSLNRDTGKDYAIIGAIVGCAVAILFISYVAPTILFPSALMSGALVGAVYRRFAGIEPLPLPEEVLATNPAHLVNADHPARRRRSVIMNG